MFLVSFWLAFTKHEFSQYRKRIRGANESISEVFLLFGKNKVRTVNIINFSNEIKNKFTLSIMVVCSLLCIERGMARTYSFDASLLDGVGKRADLTLFEEGGQLLVFIR